MLGAEVIDEVEVEQLDYIEQVEQFDFEHLDNDLTEVNDLEVFEASLVVEVEGEELDELQLQRYLHLLLEYDE